MRTDMTLQSSVVRGVLFLCLTLALGAGPLAAAPPASPAPPLPIPLLALQVQDDRDRVLTGDHTVEAGDTVEDVVVVGGTLRVRGEIRGDAVVVGGDLLLEEGATVRGDALVTGGKIVDNGGRVFGEMRTLQEGGGDVSHQIKRALLEGVAATEAGRAEREATRGAPELQQRVRVDSESSWFRPIRRGLAGLISTVALGLVLAGIGGALIFYGRPYLEAVSDTLRHSTVRSAGVGLAAGFLLVPTFVVLVVALAVTIIGIPLLLVAVPLYPLAIAAAIAFGLLAAAHAIGERTAEQRGDLYDLRHRNSYVYLFTGLGMLLAPLVAAHLLGMTGFLGFVGTLIKVVTWVGIWAAATAGFGAVILSRAGTRRTFANPPMRHDLEPDPLFDDEPFADGTHV